MLVFADSFNEPRFVAARDEPALPTDLVVVAEIGLGGALEVADTLDTLVE